MTEYTRSEALALVIVNFMSKWNPVSRSEQIRRREMRMLSEAIIKHMVADAKPAMLPKHTMVSEIVLSEMSGWHKSSTDAELRGKELLRMCDTLVDYFDVFMAQPTSLPGLPGGDPIGQATR